MRVHLCQFDLAWQDRAANHARVRDLLQANRLCVRQAERVGALFLCAKADRIDAGDRAEGDERGEIIARNARVIMVVGPKIELAIGDAVIGIGVGDAGRHRPVPRLAHG